MSDSALKQKVEPDELVFTVANRQLAARYWPGEGTPIVALHGWLDNANSFWPLIQAAKKNVLSPLAQRPILALDFNGHGLSDAFPEGELLHFMNYLLDVTTAVEAMGWERYTLMGHSMGAVVSSWIAAAFPERVAQFVAIDALGARVTEVGEVPSNIRKAIEEHHSLLAKAPRFYPAFEEAVKARMRSMFPVEEESAYLLCERGMEQSAQGWAWRTDPRLRGTSGVRLAKEEMLEITSNIQCPTLFIGANQGIAGMGYVNDYLSTLKHKTEVWLDGKHHLHMDKPQEVLAAVDDFLR